MCKNSLFLIAILFLFSCGNDENIDNPLNNPVNLIAKTEKEKAIKDYQDNFLGSAVTDVQWTGNTANCNAGSVPKAVHDKVSQRINYFRRMVGLNDNTTMDASKYKMYQEAALIMSANNKLDHTPPKDWKCWTQLGYNGANSSNLSWGSPGSNYNSTKALLGQMRDHGDNNIHVGHRRWILYSKAVQFSHGSTKNTMSLGVIGFPKTNTKIPEYIAYPPKGYVPQPLIFDRWSFGIPNADFSEATVTMTGPSGKINVTVVSRNKTYGDKTIVWEPQNITRNSTEDITYTVTISNIKKTEKSSYTYKVIIIKV